MGQLPGLEPNVEPPAIQSEIWNPPGRHFTSVTRHAMPTGKRKRTVYLPRRRKKRSRLADKKINTLVEKRMVSIAKKEAKKARASTYKDITIGNYTAFGEISAFRHDGFGTVQPLTAIPGQNALSLNDCPKWDEDHHGADLTGRRVGDDIWIKGWKFTGLLHVLGSSSMVQQRVKFALVSARRPITADHTGPALLQDYPPGMLYNDLNGSMKDESQREMYGKVDVLATKVIKLNPIAKADINRPFTFSYFFKKPRREQYDPQDIAGEYPLRRSYYFLCWTDRDHSSGSNTCTIIYDVRKYFYTE